MIESRASPRIRIFDKQMSIHSPRNRIDSKLYESSVSREKLLELLFSADEPNVSPGMSKSDVSKSKRSLPTNTSASPLALAATCDLEGDVSGKLTVKQFGGSLTVEGTLEKIPVGIHAIHVHEKGLNYVAVILRPDLHEFRSKPEPLTKYCRLLTCSTSAFTS